VIKREVYMYREWGRGGGVHAIDKSRLAQKLRQKKRESVLAMERERERGRERENAMDRKMERDREARRDLGMSPGPQI